MRHLLLAAAVCLAPLSVQAQTSDRGIAPAPAPVPAVPPPNAQTGGSNVPPEQIAPPAKGTIGGLPSGQAEHMQTNTTH